MNNDGDVIRDWRTLTLVVLTLTVLIFIANIHLEVRGEVGDVDILSRFTHSAIISFIFVNSALFMITLALSHKHAKLVEQALGTLLAAIVGALLYGLLVDSGMTVAGVATDVWSQFSIGAIRMMTADFAILLSLGASFGILLTLVTGRETPSDPLLELETTSFESEEE
ncbi:MAG: hypothetical protein P8Q39_01520 [Candidatus Thalassarchaeaceae archaeon]|jgi:hypothetical protein|nr:hypothetical protein [Candidatus Thalassarchaeaceae archaeon]